MVSVWFTGLFVVPVVGGLASTAVRSSGRGSQSRSLAVVTACLAAVCAAVLAFSAEREVHLGTWWPGTGAMSLHTGGVGGYAALATSIVAVAAVADQRIVRRYTILVVMVALAAANVAFYAGHFLLRYVALEVVALSVAAAPLIEAGGAEGTRNARLAYVLLRVGDAGLLSAILLLMDASGTLDIATALSAAPGLDPAWLAWVAAGMTLAAWVKIGVWPLALWKRARRSLSPLTGMWLYDVVVPNLGLYLLYRTSSLIASSTPLRWLIFASAGVSGVLGIARMVLRRQIEPEFGSLLGAVALCCAALDQGTFVAALLLAGTAARVVFALSAHREIEDLGAVRGPAFYPRGSAVGRWLGALVGKPRDAVESEAPGGGSAGLWRPIETAAELLDRVVEHDVLEQGIAWLWRSIESVAALIHRAVERDLLDQGIAWLGRWTQSAAEAMHRAMERDLLDQGIAWLGRRTQSAAAAMHHAIEREGFERFIREVAQTVNAAGRVLQRWHTGRLRANLRWALAALLIAVVAFSLWGW